VSPQTLTRLERLAASNINLLSAVEIAGYFVVERGGYIALVERTESGFGRVGGAGLLTESGFAALVWRGSHAFFTGKSYERPASEAEVADLRAFQADLTAALA
jgi:hypothetical protein